MKSRLTFLFVYVAAMFLCLGSLAWGKPLPLVGLFVVSGLAVGSLYALGGVGLVVLYRTTGVLNFASGAMGAIGVMTAWQLLQWGWNEPLSWVVALLVATTLSLGYGYLIAPRLAWRDPVVKAIATLGFALIILGFTSFLWIDQVRSFTLPTDQMAFRVLGLRVTVTRFTALAATLVVVAAIWWFLERTRTGLQMRALANERDLSALIGVPILTVETIAWGMAGLIAGFTGLMFGDLIRLEPSVITFMVIPSIAAAICGRLDSLALVVLGGLSIGVLESMLTLSPMLKSVRTVSPFVVAIVVLLLLQRGKRILFEKDE
ncbi:MAG TPA: branched-chain amino acid ABC transporter permease [Rhodoferax sp.]